MDKHTHSAEGTSNENNVPIPAFISQVLYATIEELKTIRNFTKNLKQEVSDLKFIIQQTQNCLHSINHNIVIRTTEISEERSVHIKPLKKVVRCIQSLNFDYL